MRVMTQHETLRFIDEYRELFDAEARRNPFMCAAWMRLFVQHIATGAWSFFAPVADDGRSLMLFYSDDGRRTWHAVANYYTSLHSPLVSTLDAGAARQRAITALVEQIATYRPRPAILDLAPLDEDDGDTQSLRQALAARGWLTRQYDRFGNWYLPCKGVSFSDYMAARDSQTRNTWTRKKKQFAANGEARLEIVQAPADVPRAMDAYERIYALSWKQPEPYAGFVRDWAMACAQHGWLRLGLAWQGDVPIAAQFWFTLHGRASIFKLAYDQEYARLSAGTVLSAHLFEYALDHDRVSEIDYLTGDDPYKRSWMGARRQRIGLVACNPMTLRGIAAGAREMAGQMRQRLRRSPSTQTDTEPDR
ncbi:GNAT family N-acetyltransferase [Uliginosibacterium sp. sgz301328]|uniref:GNAT family N-acetyltransferase n=1 Tax=Uliginosibacterium sp. sgz301328 TaxID=3243764 RepID=UPI00359CBBD5